MLLTKVQLSSFMRKSMIMDSSHKQMIFLLILPLVFASVQSFCNQITFPPAPAPSHNCTDYGLAKKLIVQFYCKSLDMEATVCHMVEVSKIMSY